jgi:hypothetical protein
MKTLKKIRKKLTDLGIHTVQFRNNSLLVDMI